MQVSSGFRHTNRVRMSCVAALLAFLVLLTPITTAAVAAQTTTASTTAPPSKVQADTSAASTQVPIPLSLIALEAESASVKLRRIKLETDKALKVADVESRLADLVASLQRFRPLLESGETPHTEELVNLRQELKRLSLQLVAVQATVTPRSQLVEARSGELHRMELLWKGTFDALNLKETPITTRQLITSVQNEIQSVLSTIAPSRPRLLALQARTSEQRIALDNLLAQTDEAVQEARTRLFAIDSDPFWKAAVSASLSDSVTQSLRGFFQRGVLPFWDYLRDDQKRFSMHLLLSLLLVWVLANISKRSRAWSDDTDGETHSFVQHPVAAAAILSLMLSFNIYANAPLFVYRLCMLSMVVPLLALVSSLSTRNGRKVFYFVSALYVLQIVDELVASDDFLHRIALMALTSVSLAGVWMAAKARDLELPAGFGPWRHTRSYLLRLAGLLLLVSLTANLVGSVGLSTLLTDGTISSTFTGAALYVGVLTLEGYLVPLLRSPLARRSAAIRAHRELFRRRASLLIRLGALAVWISFTFRLFGLSGPIRATFDPLLAQQWSFGSLTFSLHGILVFAITVSVSALAARFIGFMLEEDVLPRLSLPQGMPATVSLLVRDLIIGLGFVMALAGAGLQWSQIMLVAGAIGVGVGLGLQNLVASFVAGLILIFERPIRVGDSVEIGKIMGVVTRIGLRSSSIRTYDGSEVICPNSNLISQELVNWTLSDQIRRVEVQVGADYGSNPETVLAILTTIAKTHPKVLPYPEPVALFRGFGDSSLNFALRCFTSFDNWLMLTSEMGIRINEGLQKAGVKIPFPQRDIRITSEPVMTRAARQ